MKTATDRVREQIIHDLKDLYAKYDKMEKYHPPIWQSLRFFGLITVFIAALAWYTQTEIGLTIGVVCFVVGSLLIMVPRGARFSSILRWDGGIKLANPQLELQNLDEHIRSLESTLERMEEEARDVPTS
jgi:hypothetical protein